MKQFLIQSIAEIQSSNPVFILAGEDNSNQSRSRSNTVATTHSSSDNPANRAPGDDEETQITLVTKRSTLEDNSLSKSEKKESSCEFVTVKELKQLIQHQLGKKYKVDITMDPKNPLDDFIISVSGPKLKVNYSYRDYKEQSVAFKAARAREAMLMTRNQEDGRKIVTSPTHQKNIQLDRFVYDAKSKEYKLAVKSKQEFINNFNKNYLKQMNQNEVFGNTFDNSGNPHAIIFANRFEEDYLNQKNESLSLKIARFFSIKKEISEEQREAQHLDKDFTNIRAHFNSWGMGRIAGSIKTLFSKVKSSTLQHIFHEKDRLCVDAQIAQEDAKKASRKLSKF